MDFENLYEFTSDLVRIIKRDYERAQRKRQRKRLLKKAIKKINPLTYIKHKKSGLSKILSIKDAAC